jgi:hypothetical protein
MAESCKGKVCPRLSAPGSLVNCIEHQCAHFQMLLGAHPQSGASIQEWDCAFNWTSILLIEVSKEVRQGAAATESFRNEVKTGQSTFTGMLNLAAVRAAEAYKQSERRPILGALRRLIWRKA